MNQELLGSAASSRYLLVRPTREMVRCRTLELASITGKEAHQIRQADYEQAKRELTGQTNFDRQQEILDGWG